MMAVIHAPQPLPAHVPVVAAPAPPPIDLLLVEPQFLLRRTVAAVARDMRLANPKELTTIEQADTLLSLYVRSKRCSCRWTRKPPRSR